MPRIKNWRKSKKYDGTNPQRYTIWSNTRPEYKEFHDNHYVTVGGEGSDWSVTINKGGYQKIYSNQLRGNGFSSYDEAVAFAVDYMRRNP